MEVKVLVILVPIILDTRTIKLSMELLIFEQKSLIRVKNLIQALGLITAVPEVKIMDMTIISMPAIGKRNSFLKAIKMVTNHLTEIIVNPTELLTVLQLWTKMTKKRVSAFFAVEVLIICSHVLFSNHSCRVAAMFYLF